MKKTTIALAVTLLCATGSTQETNKFKNDAQRYSYAIGADTGNRMKQSEIELDFDFFMRGLKEAHAGGTLLLTETELRETFNKLRQELTAKQQEKQRLAVEKFRQQGEKNKPEGEAFLAANKTKPGVITLPNGLQYKVLAEGTGESPKAEDIVDVNYRGTFVDGTEFDSNAKTGRPFTTPLNRNIIRGWSEAITRMKPGAKWQLFIPAELAYGEAGRQPSVPPHTALIFDVELLSFKAAPPPPAAPTPQPLTSDIIKVPSLEEMKKGAKIETIKAEDVEKLQKAAQEKPKE